MSAERLTMGVRLDAAAMTADLDAAASILRRLEPRDVAERFERCLSRVLHGRLDDEILCSCHVPAAGAGELCIRVELNPVGKLRAIVTTLRAFDGE